MHATKSNETNELHQLIREKYCAHLVRGLLRQDLPAEVQRQVKTTHHQIHFKNWPPGKHPKGEALHRMLVHAFTGGLQRPFKEFLRIWSDAYPTLAQKVGAALAAREQVEPGESGEGKDIKLAEALVGELGLKMDEVVLTLASLRLKARQAASGGASSVCSDDAGHESLQEEVSVAGSERPSGLESDVHPSRSSVEALNFSEAPSNAFPATSVQPSADRWAEILHDLEVLAAESVEWERIEVFLERASKIAAKKAEERLPRRRIAELLAALATFEEELGYFDTTDVKAWSAFAIEPSKLAEGIQVLERLLEDVPAFAAVRARKCARRQEELLRREEEKRLDDACSAGLEQLRTLFAQSPTTEEPVGAQESPEPTPAPQVEATRLVDITLVSGVMPPEVLALRENPPASLAEEASVAEEGPAEPAPEPTRAEVVQSLPDAPPTAEKALSPAQEPRAESAPSAVAVEPARVVPPAPASVPERKSEPSRVSTSVDQTRISLLSDEQITDGLLRRGWAAGIRPEVIRAVTAEQQTRWLARGENLRAYLLARYAEDAETFGEKMIPSWLCWLAIMLNDPGFNPVEPAASEIGPMLFKLNRYSREEQRFAVAWLSAALLGPDPTRAMEMAPHLPREVHSLPWLAESMFYQFCAEHLLGPARQNRRPQLKTHEPIDAIRARLGREITDARNILSLPPAYRNTQVKRFWGQLIRREGPVHMLIDDAEARQVDIPSAETLAKAVPGWEEIIGLYGHNMLMRLEKLVLHLEQARVLHGVLSNRAASQENVLPLDRVNLAIREGQAIVQELSAARSPSALGFKLALTRLRDALPEEKS